MQTILLPPKTRLTRKGPVIIKKTARVTLEPADVQEAIARYISDNMNESPDVDDTAVPVLYNDDKTCLIIGAVVDIAYDE